MTRRHRIWNNGTLAVVLPALAVSALSARNTYGGALLPVVAVALVGMGALFGRRFLAAVREPEDGGRLLEPDPEADPATRSRRLGGLVAVVAGLLAIAAFATSQVAIESALAPAVIFVISFCVITALMGIAGIVRVLRERR